MDTAQAGVELSMKRVLTLELAQSIAAAAGAGAQILRSATNIDESSLKRIRSELEQPVEAVDEVHV